MNHVTQPVVFREEDVHLEIGDRGPSDTVIDPDDDLPAGLIVVR